jgi:hypothetical protein
VSSFSRLQSAADADSSLPDDQYHAYTANINSRKFAFKGSYAIYVFLGNVTSENAAEWPLASNLVGTQGVFTGMTMPVAASSNKMSSDGTQDSSDAAGGNVTVTGTVPLTDALLKHVKSGELASLKEADVRVFLRKNLQWRIGKVCPRLFIPMLSCVHLTGQLISNLSFSTTAPRSLIPVRRIYPLLSSPQKSNPPRRPTNSRLGAISLFWIRRKPNLGSLQKLRGCEYNSMESASPLIVVRLLGFGNAGDARSKFLVHGYS